MSMPHTYQQAVDAYVAGLRGLSTPPAQATGPAVTRGSAAMPTELLAERAEALVGASRHLGELTAEYLDAAQQAQREAAEMKLLAQAAAEFEVARGLLARAAQESEPLPAAAVSRSAGAGDVQEAIQEWLRVLDAPLDADALLLPTARATRRGGQRLTDPREAKVDLQAEVQRSLQEITRQASKVGGRAARDLLLLDHAALVQGMSFVSKDAAALLERLTGELGALAGRLARAALQLLLHAYDWVLALLGNAVEHAARQQVQAWLEELRSEAPEGRESEGLFGNLVARLYTPYAISTEVSAWLEASQAEAASINEATEIVEGLAEKYRAKAEQVDRFLKVIALAKQVPVVNAPPGQVLAAAVTLGLLGYVLYAGYDHVDSGGATLTQRFGISIPNRVEGVRATVHKRLGVA